MTCKKLVIKYCKECPNRESEYIDGECHLLHRFVYPYDTIPEDCPLESCLCE